MEEEAVEEYVSLLVSMFGKDIILNDYLLFLSIYLPSPHLTTAYCQVSLLCDLHISGKAQIQFVLFFHP